MDDVINLDSIRAEVDRKGTLLSETWTDLYSLLTKYQAQLHVKYDGIRGVIKTEKQLHEPSESQELNLAKQEIQRKEGLLSKYQIDLIKTTDTLERVKHELRLCQAKLEQVNEIKQKHEDEATRLKSTSEKREQTICQLKQMIYQKETELVHKSRLLANTAGMYDGAVAKSLQLTSENNHLREELDRHRQMHDEFVKQCTCNSSKRRRKMTSPSPMSAPVSLCTSPVNDKSPPPPTPLTPITPSPTTTSHRDKEFTRSHSTETAVPRDHSRDSRDTIHRQDSREHHEYRRQNSSEHREYMGEYKAESTDSRSSNPSPVQGKGSRRQISPIRPGSSQEYRTQLDQRSEYAYRAQEYARDVRILASPTNHSPIIIPLASPILFSNRPTLPHLPLRSSTPTSESPVQTPTVLANSVNMAGTLGKARKAMAALAKSESREEKESEEKSDTNSPPTESGGAAATTSAPTTVMVYEQYPAGALPAVPLLHKPSPIFGIMPAGSLPAHTALSNSTLTSSGIDSAGGSNTSLGGVSCTNSVGSNSCNSSNSSMDADEREPGEVAIRIGTHVLSRLPQTGKTERPRKRCRVCYRSGKRKETPYHCPQCPGKPGLCANPCFHDYHGKLATGEWKDMVENSKDMNSPLASPSELDDERSQPIFPRTEEKRNDVIPNWLKATPSGEVCDKKD